jgi:hypothetical protein
MEEGAELFPGSGVEASVLAETVLGAGFELIEIPSGFGDSDDRNGEGSSLDHGLQRREDFFVGEVAGCSEEDEGVGMNLGHKYSFHCAATSQSDYVDASFNRIAAPIPVYLGSCG